MITGTLNQSAIATLVECTTRYVKLVHLPGAHTAEAVPDGLVAMMATPPEHLRGSTDLGSGVGDMVGRIPDGPHRLAEAEAHLARANRAQQARLDRRAALIAAGKKPMDAPSVPLEHHSRIIRARKVVARRDAAAVKVDASTER